MIAPWPMLAASAIALAAGFAGGYALKARMAEAEISRLHSAHAAARAAAAQAMAARFSRAQDAEQAAVHALHETEKRLTATQRRLKDALYSLDPGRCGLTGRARGLLNDAIADAGKPLPEGAAEPADAAAGPAADSDVSRSTGEREVALWIAEAIGLYEACRARIDAIRHWDEVTHGR